MEILKYCIILFFAYSFLLTGTSSQNEASSMHENMANEIYDPEIGSINTLQALKKNIQTIVEQENLSGIEIPIYIDDLLRKKFMHGSSSINTKGNWLLQAADTILIDELAFSFSAEDVAMQQYEQLQLHGQFDQDEKQIFQKNVPYFHVVSPYLGIFQVLPQFLRMKRVARKEPT